MPLRAFAKVLSLSLAASCAPLAARAQCTFTTGPTTIAFGAYVSSSGAPTNSTGTFVFDCPNGSYRPDVQLSSGNAGTFTPRQMSLGADRLDYNLYQDAACTIIWGDGTSPTWPQRTGTRRRTTYTIYGRIPAGQWVAAGTYADTILITLNY